MSQLMQVQVLPQPICSQLNVDHCKDYFADRCVFLRYQIDVIRCSSLIASTLVSLTARSACMRGAEISSTHSTIIKADAQELQGTPGAMHDEGRKLRRTSLWMYRSYLWRSSSDQRASTDRKSVLDSRGTLCTCMSMGIPESITSPFHAGKWTPRT